MADPSEVELGQLHERLLAGDPVAPAELAARLLPLLRARLAAWAATVDDPHLVPSAIGLVVARYLADPERFDPERGGLAGYLAMEVRRRGGLLTADGTATLLERNVCRRCEAVNPGVGRVLRGVLLRRPPGGADRADAGDARQAARIHHRR